MPSVAGRGDAGSRDAVVIGAGPNGLAAALVCAATGLRVTVYEAEDTIGGGARTEALTLPGFLHDHCSSVFPLGIASPFFRALPIEEYGVEWMHAPYPLAHPLDGGDAVVLHKSLRRTASALGSDAAKYHRLLSPLARNWEALVRDILAPPRLPSRPLLLARFGRVAVLPATWLASRLATGHARSLVAGLAAHSAARLESPLTSAFALLLASLAHSVGWPVARGGAQSISNAMAACLRQLEGRIVRARRIDSLAEIEPALLTLCDIAPEQLARIGSERLPAPFARHMLRFERGPGVFKVDWALDGPIPWRAEACRQAATIHVGGSFEEIAASERQANDGREPERPFVIVAQPSVCDPSRAPERRHVAWGYCHVPAGSAVDMTEAIERQVERFAPGFRDRILARHVMAPADLARSNATLVGGDITGGRFTVRQLIARPSWQRYRTPAHGVYLCSASTPPGPGVHGMCGYWAARRALHDVRRGQAHVSDRQQAIGNRQ